MSGFNAFVESIPRPFISEMGGKNPAIITKTADLEKATDGVLKAAFGYSGQKCSACSRVYVQKDIANQFVEKVGCKDQGAKDGQTVGKRCFCQSCNK
ncbi:aldehyde dehydrogenase family protein [Candidatus Nitrosotalea sp. TS]|uniref:aldehyde dehydrogenase family protein n=1 Tax=Candidatus Nitrosotalea sp. TS TaxID=2341020 RepID=UPI0021071A45|nr:aldehyde dehydrogenase family protein [Candidatus Nitrosotalea sp. TS]